MGRMPDVETGEVAPKRPERLDIKTNLVGDFKFFYLGQEFKGKKFKREDVKAALGLIEAKPETKDHVVADREVNEVVDKSSEAAVLKAGERSIKKRTIDEMQYKGLTELTAFFIEMSQAATLGGGEYSSVRMLTIETGAAEYLISRNQADLQTLDANRAQYTGDNTHQGIQNCYALSKADGEKARSIFEKNDHRVVDNKIGPGFQAEMGGIRFLFVYLDEGSSFKVDETGEPVPVANNTEKPAEPTEEAEEEMQMAA